MDYLVAHYTGDFSKIEGNVFEVYAKFSKLDMGRIHTWLEKQFEETTVKDNTISATHRQEGNSFFRKRNLMKSLELYTKSLCFATASSKEFALALANRSAVSLELKQYHHCLRDIDLCFKTNYPNDLKPKIYLRRAECLLELNEQEALKKCISEGCNFLETENVLNKDKYIVKLKNILNQKPKMHDDAMLLEEDLSEAPYFDDEENECLAYASKKVRMCYTKEKGRHIIADKDIKRGDTLFIEKAFIFAPVFKENKECNLFKCYNCLKNVISCIPCLCCTVCVFCDTACRDTSWSSCHQWECKGMRANIWYELGIAFPAFKAMVKGVTSGFETPVDGHHAEDVKKFGDKENNYKYFCRLLSNIYNTENMVPYLVMAAVVVEYLQKYTNFFSSFVENTPKEDSKNFVRTVGGLITKHIAQLACNSGTIEHWTCSSSDILFPDILVSVACGVFPTVSIMNHSCRPNVTNYFICDTIVVKALEDIAQNQEIFNCYGIDYRAMTREERQFACKKQYFFECNCSICAHPVREIEMLNSYLCLSCRGFVPETSNSTFSFCLNCGKKHYLDNFRKVNMNTHEYLEDESQITLRMLLRCLKIREKILCQYHKDFEDLYYRLYSHYVKKDDCENMYKYFHLWLEIEKARRGVSARGIGTKLYEAAVAILYCLRSGQQANCRNLKDFLKNVEYMIKEAKIILNLYYPAYIMARLANKIKIISYNKLQL